MELDLTRRGVLLGGCGFAAMLAIPLDAQAALTRRGLAPRHRCPHTGCRHFRPDGGHDGICAMSIGGEVVPTIEVPA